MLTANHIHLVKTEAITLSTSSSELYAIDSVSPLLINNDDIVTVKFHTSSPSSGDWIGAYSPPSVDILVTSPVKFGMCDAASSAYLQSGIGELTFNMTNLRSGIMFYYFSGSLDLPIMQVNSSVIVEFKNVNQPLRNRIIATGDQNVYKLLWSSAYSESPVLYWGTEPSNYPYAVNASSSSISNSSLCGAPATTTGFRDLGLIHTANITGILDLSINGGKIYYKFGDLATNDFSKEFTFYVPPKPGSQPVGRGTQIVVFADLGVGSTDTSYDTNIWSEACPPAANTSNSAAALVEKGLVDAVYHSGDISYANGYLAGWDFFLDMISPMAGSAVYLTTVGNHESDWVNSTSLQGYGYGDASGGECGVPATELLPMPYPATTNEPWWSYDIGLMHLIGISSEHNYSIGSPQYQWLEGDLRSVNRTLTPWIIFSSHRSMYVDSAQCCENYDDDDCAVCLAGTDMEVMFNLQANVEPLLYKYQVNLAFAGHFHDVERQAAVYQNQVVQHATTVRDSDGNEVAYHEAPNATVWMIVGSGGNGPSIASRNYSWSEKYWDDVFGYAVITAVNATTLQWYFVNSASDQVMDRMVVTRDPDAVWYLNQVSDDASSSSSSSSGWSGLTVIEQGVTIAAIVVVVISVAAWLGRNYLMSMFCSPKEPLLEKSREVSLNKV